MYLILSTLGFFLCNKWERVILEDRYPNWKQYPKIATSGMVLRALVLTKNPRMINAIKQTNGKSSATGLMDFSLKTTFLMFIIAEITANEIEPSIQIRWNGGQYSHTKPNGCHWKAAAPKATPSNWENTIDKTPSIGPLTYPKYKNPIWDSSQVAVMNGKSPDISNNNK